jgi:hypothetical protein
VGRLTNHRFEIGGIPDQILRHGGARVGFHTGWVGLSRWLGSRAVDDFEGPRMASLGGKEAFPILPAYDLQASQAVIHRLKPRHRGYSSGVAG